MNYHQLVDKKSISTFRGKYKKSTIERPPIVNGLEEIGIYKDQELEEQINLVINPTESATPSQNNSTEDLIV